jgi:hypothetical protein
VGALANAFRRFLGEPDRPGSGGLVLAAKHFEHVNQTVRRVEARAEVRPPAAFAREYAAPTPPSTRPASASAARASLADWDLPPGLASVVQSGAAGDRAAPSPAPASARLSTRVPDEGPSARQRTAPVEASFRHEGPLASAEMDALLAQLAD